LVHLELQGNHIGHLGVGLLQKAWRHVRKPEEGLIVISVDASEQERRISVVAKVDDPDFFYEGMYKNSQRHGHGTLANRITGFKYVGQFKDDLFEGEGNATWQDGSKYSGQWSDGQKCGKGEFTSADGVKYAGEWKDGHRQGYGVQEYEDGGLYNGMWSNGVCGGQGTYTFTDGSRYSGSWRNGRYNGPGVMYHQDGTTEKLQYKDGLLMSRHVIQTESLPIVDTRSGRALVVGKSTLRQMREEVHKPTQLPRLQTSGKLIARTYDGIDLSAPPLRPLSERRLDESYTSQIPQMPFTVR
jgi:hypothetical protein